MELIAVIVLVACLVAVFVITRKDKADTPLDGNGSGSVGGGGRGDLFDNEQVK